jgi:hypothetical protein
MKRIFIFLFGIVILAGTILACGESTTSTSSPSTGGSTPIKPINWQTTHTFTGTGAKKTETITVPNDWKITWSCQGTDGIDAPLYVNAYNPDGSIADSDIVSTTCKATGTTTDSSEQHSGGNIYLDINTGITWTLTIQEPK